MADGDDRYQQRREELAARNEEIEQRIGELRERAAQAGRGETVIRRFSCGRKMPPPYHGTRE